MSNPPVVHNTFVIERSYPHPVQKVFAAFSDPGKKRRWFAEGHSHEVEEYRLDFRVGGSEHSAYRFEEGTPFPGVLLAAESVFLDIVSEQRIVQAGNMAIGGRRISAALATFQFISTANGTDLVFTHQAAFFEGADGPQMREQGWRKLLDQLEANLAT
ncbi:MAG TPA: SRPBCC family protein [Candidatus Bathyarchaeia archaeon]|nr:SRPBCC family protein [Candidatus Bathyarchaeia archaeon]